MYAAHVRSQLLTNTTISIFGAPANNTGKLVDLKSNHLCARAQPQIPRVVTIRYLCRYCRHWTGIGDKIVDDLH